mmetsp:Transcript_3503/g.6751  ORF Transcript_3503/g.6751 Transcript_3503/m.6751 type:complete len:319 (+) Transcript_3503:3895-4851(+)
MVVNLSQNLARAKEVQKALEALRASPIVAEKENVPYWRRTETNYGAFEQPFSGLPYRSVICRCKCCRSKEPCVHKKECFYENDFSPLKRRAKCVSEATQTDPETPCGQHFARANKKTECDLESKRNVEQGSAAPSCTKGEQATSSEDCRVRVSSRGTTSSATFANDETSKSPSTNTLNNESRQRQRAAGKSSTNDVQDKRRERQRTPNSRKNQRPPQLDTPKRLDHSSHKNVFGDDYKLDITTDDLTGSGKKTRLHLSPTGSLDIIIGDDDDDLLTSYSRERETLKEERFLSASRLHALEATVFGRHPELAAKFDLAF